MPTSDINSQSLTDNKTLIDILLFFNLITKEQYDDIRIKSASRGISQEAIIKDSNFVPEKKLTEIRAKMIGVPFISLETT